jgi:hypothetical protein
MHVWRDVVTKKTAHGHGKRLQQRQGPAKAGAVRSARPTAKDPQFAGARPPFRNAKQLPPGKPLATRPLPDHCERAYRSSGRRAGPTALSADSGIGGARAIAFAREGADVLFDIFRSMRTPGKSLHISATTHHPSSVQRSRPSSLLAMYRSRPERQATSPARCV